MKVEPLKLTAEHFPLPRSLLSHVVRRYADPLSRSDADLAMDTTELLSYLRNVDYDKFSPLEGVLALTDAVGDPALPTGEQSAILNWLDTAYGDWEQQFALEEPLATQMRRLRPLLAALSVTDPTFLTPGTHPLHQLLDTIQQYAIGWQPRLGRVGQALEQQVHEVVDAALAWFDSPAKDLAAVSADIAASTAKAQARASRMAQRLSETEHGRLRIRESKQQAARMINAALEKYPAPAAIGQFLKGPWYDSAQLALLKFGAESAEWGDMSRTTTRLLLSLQGPPVGREDDAEHRQQVFRLASQLAKSLPRGLLSLEHDGEAVNAAIELIDFFHSKALGKQALELETIPPIALQEIVEQEPCQDQTVSQLKEGQWFILDTDNSQSLRATLVLRMDAEQQLLFANQAGIKVLQLGFVEFARQMAQGKVTLLDTGASFSRCLAHCAGIETQDDLDELTGVAAQKARLREKQRQAAERKRAQLEREQAARDRAEQERQQREQAKVNQLRRERQIAERLRQEQEAAASLRREQAEQERQRSLLEQEQMKRLQAQWTEATLQLRKHNEQAPRQGPAVHTMSTERRPNDTNLQLPTGTWLGFRENDKTIMARLAVYNREQDYYIFVNRYGVSVRKLSGRELLLLVARGLVDILEARSGFKEQVTRAQAQNEGPCSATYTIDFQIKGPSRRPDYIRQEPWLPIKNTVFIELVSPEFGSNQPGTITRCTSPQVSRRRLRVELGHELPVGALLQVAVELPAAAGTLYLVGEVTLSGPIPGTGAGSGWLADLLLLDADDSDIETWVMLLTTMERA